ncbi:hypothetical protein [Hallella colorans]|nr:hypothetical protein [Hallella colorans]
MKILLRIYNYDLPHIYYKPRKANGRAQAPKTAGAMASECLSGPS